MSDIQNLAAIVQNHEESSYKRRDAFTKLTRLNPPDLVGILTPAITADGDRYLNQDLVKHLASLKSTDCFEALERALVIDDPYVKTYAIQGLGDIGDTRAVDALRPFLDDRSYSIKTVAEQAIEKLGGLPDVPTVSEEEPVGLPSESSEDEGEQITDASDVQIADADITEESVSAEEVPVIEPEVESEVEPEPQRPVEAVTKEPAGTVPETEPDAPTPAVEPLELPSEPEPPPVAENTASVEDGLSCGETPESSAAVGSPTSQTFEVKAELDETSMQRFFGEKWELVKPVYLEYKEVSASIPEQEARSLERAQGLKSFHADKDDDIAELDKTIEELKGQVGRQDISIDRLNDQIADIQQQLASPFIGVADMFTRKKETLTLELTNVKHMRNRLTKSRASNKKELKKSLAYRKKLTEKLATLEAQHDKVSGTLKTMLDRLEAIDRHLDDCYDDLISSLPKKDLLLRIEDTCGSRDNFSFVEHCLGELIHELQELNRNRELLRQCTHGLSEEQQQCYSATDELASDVGSGFRLNEDTVHLNFNIYGQLDFEEESSFWGGFSNVDGSASGMGTARTEFQTQKVNWSHPEGLDGRVKNFAESWRSLGTATAQGELIHSMVTAGQHTVKEYIRLIRKQVEAGNHR